MSDVDMDEIGSDIEEYEVEKILDRRVVRGVVEYYLKWKGFGLDECTWEARANLSCQDLIEQYERTHPQEKKVRRRKPRESRDRDTSPSDDHNMDSISGAQDTTFEKKTVSKRENIVNPLEKGNAIRHASCTSLTVCLGIEAQEILEASRINQKLCFRVKWKDNVDCDWVAAPVANVAMPQLVYRYYEQLANPTANIF